MDNLRHALLGRYRLSNRAPEAVEASFRHTLNQLSGNGMLTTMDEETITAAILGGFITSFPICTAAFAPETPPGEPADPTTQPRPRCAWGQYGKAAGGEAKELESRRGADFALIIWDSEEWARVALFQAKRLEPPSSSGSANPSHTLANPGDSLTVNGAGPLEAIAPGTALLNVHRRTDKVAGKPWRPSQMVTLEQTGRWLMMAEDVRAGNGSLDDFKKAIAAADRVVPQAQREERLGDESEDEFAAFNFRAVLDQHEYKNDHGKVEAFWRAHLRRRTPVPAQKDMHWIHYLAYTRAAATATDADGVTDPFDDMVLCVPLSGLTDKMDREREETPFKKNVIDLSTAKAYRFIDVLLNAFGPDNPGLDGDRRDGWLAMHTDTVKAMLPRLQQLGTVFVTTDKGGRSTNVVLDATLSASCDATPASAPDGMGQTAQNAVPAKADIAALDATMQPAKPGYRPPKFGH